MKKILFVLTCLFLLILPCQHSKAQNWLSAPAQLGGYITFDHLGNYYYDVHFTYFRDCSLPDPGSTMNLNIQKMNNSGLAKIKDRSMSEISRQQHQLIREGSCNSRCVEVIVYKLSSERIWAAHHKDIYFQVINAGWHIQPLNQMVTVPGGMHVFTKMNVNHIPFQSPVAAGSIEPILQCISNTETRDMSFTNGSIGFPLTTTYALSPFRDGVYTPMVYQPGYSFTNIFGASAPNSSLTLSTVNGQMTINPNGAAAGHYAVSYDVIPTTPTGAELGRISVGLLMEVDVCNDVDACFTSQPAIEYCDPILLDLSCSNGGNVNYLEVIDKSTSTVIANIAIPNGQTSIDLIAELSSLWITLNPGECYDVKLHIEQICTEGNSAIDEIVQEICVPEGSACFTLMDIGCEDLPIYPDLSCLNTIASNFTWTVYEQGTLNPVGFDIGIGDPRSQMIDLHTIMFGNTQEMDAGECYDVELQIWNANCFSGSQTHVQTICIDAQGGPGLAGADQAICIGQSVQIGIAPGLGGNPGANSVWNDGTLGFTRTVSPSQTTTYTVTTTYDQGCPVVDEVTVRVYQGAPIFEVSGGWQGIPNAPVNFCQNGTFNLILADFPGVPGSSDGDWVINWGDGTIETILEGSITGVVNSTGQTEFTIPHVYSSIGNFVIQVYLQNPCGRFPLLSDPSNLWNTINTINPWLINIIEAPAVSLTGDCGSTNQLVATITNAGHSNYQFLWFESNSTNSGFNTGVTMDGFTTTNSGPLVTLQVTDLISLCQTTITYQCEFVEELELDLELSEPGLGGFGKLSQTTTEISAYPNPFSDVLRINTQEMESGSVIIYDALGQIVYESDIFTGSNINTKDWSDGLYIITVQTESEVVFKDKMIKTN